MTTSMDNAVGVGDRNSGRWYRFGDSDDGHEGEVVV